MRNRRWLFLGALGAAALLPERSDAACRVQALNSTRQILSELGLPANALDTLESDLRQGRVPRAFWDKLLEFALILLVVYLVANAVLAFLAWIINKLNPFGNNKKDADGATQAFQRMF